jgi:D-Tyr-tRNAtyr deacylase
MRAVVQRVLSASVTGLFLCLHVVSALVENRSLVDSEIVSEISRGLMVLVGIGVGT